MYANSGMAIGGKVSNATTGSVLYADTFNLLSQDNANFFWDSSAKRLGLGTNAPACILDISGNFSAGAFVAEIKNASAGNSAAAAWRSLNDSSHMLETGFGSTGRSDLLADSAYWYASAGSSVFINQSSNPFQWAFGGTASSNVKMALSTAGLVLSGSTSGAVTVSPAATGTWTLTLPVDGGTSGYVLSTDGSGVTSWIAGGGGGGGTIGDLITGATSTSSNALEIVRNDSGADTGITVQNQASDGNSAFIATNDVGHFCFFGMAGSADGTFAGKGFTYCSNGGFNFVNADSSAFIFTQGSTDVATINSSGWLGLGTTSPQGPLDLQGTVSGGALSIIVKNLANDGASCVDVRGDTGNFVFFGYGGSARGDNLQDRGFIYSQHGGFNLCVGTTDPFQVTIGGSDNSDSYLFVSTAGVGIGAGNTSPAASAVLDVASTTQGFAPPRMSTTQKNAIASPAEGLMVYDLTLHKLSVFTGSVWETVTSV